ncbi:Nn.00g087550.m01.CDS01 [Neocucurbitaria sp. VM-36]
MGDTFVHTGILGATQDRDTSPGPKAASVPKPQYVAYRPPDADFTPPASPQPQNPYAAKRGFGFHRSSYPEQLQMDPTVSPAYERPAYNSSPSDSPILPPTSLPSPKFPPRQRAPSLLRHAAVPSSSPLLEGHMRPEQPAVSPTNAPAMIRQGSGPGSPDLRAIFNPLASNPVNSSGPAWDLSTDDLAGAATHSRPRGLTSSSQSPFQPTPPLRSVTSIPDYAQYRGSARSNLSGTYKPNRGVPNWSHTDYYPPPPRPFRGEEPRASFRSGWTNTSSSVMEASGTERSSVVTARSSIVSERQASIYSRDQSMDRLRDRDDSPETVQTSEVAEEEEDHLDAVSDVLDAYYYDEDDQERNQELEDHNSRTSLRPSPVPLESEPPELSQTPSRDLDSLDSFQSSENLKHWDDRPLSYGDNSLDGNVEKISLSKKPLTINLPSLDSAGRNGSEANNLPLQISPFQAQYTPMSTGFVEKKSDTRQSGAWQRSSEELPRRISVTLQALALGATSTTDRLNNTKDIGPKLKGPSLNHSKLTEMRREISGLPQLPTKKSRLSRQDWADIEAYSNKHSKRPSASRTISNDSIVSKSGLQSPVLQKSEPLPEVDEDEAIPRRASTSVFDRKSTLFNLGTMAPLTASKTAAARELPAASPAQQLDEVRLRKMAAPVERDRYGFKKASDKIKVHEYNAWASKYEEHISRRRNKWIALMAKQGLPTTEPTKFPDMCEKVKRYARKGYPPEWRGAMWWYYSGGQHMIQQKEVIGLYASLVARVNRDELNKDDKDAIERDLDRTFPDNIHFRPEPATDLLDGESDDEPALIRDLREVLSCFALNNPNIGYCQSLNFIAGLLLLFLKQDKERVFILLTIITQNHLPGAHARSLANTEVNVLMMLIKDYLPKVWGSINDTDLINSGAGSNAHPNSKFQRQPTVALSCTSWFMSIFVGVLPIETVLRVWDAFLYEGPRALYRYALAIFKLGEAEIKKYRPGDGELFMTVQNLPRKCIDPNILHDLAFVKKGFGNLSQTVIDQKRLFWREQNKMAHQVSVKGNRGMLGPPKEEEEDGDSLRKAMGMGGLRRKASRRFRKRRG